MRRVTGFTAVLLLALLGTGIAGATAGGPASRAASAPFKDSAWG
ncbi:hypothetical protein [Streptomyces sp. NBC_01216]|nr:hypothetical protein OG393_06370 [Streptomyces sp. NBC_01216]